MIDVLDWSSNMVLSKWSPVPPTPVNNSTLVPSGPVRYPSRKPTLEWVIESSTFRSPIRCSSVISISEIIVL